MKVNERATENPQTYYGILLVSVASKQCDGTLNIERNWPRTCLGLIAACDYARICSGANMCVSVCLRVWVRACAIMCGMSPIGWTMIRLKHTRVHVDVCACVCLDFVACLFHWLCGSSDWKVKFKWLCSAGGQIRPWECVFAQHFGSISCGNMNEHEVHLIDNASREFAPILQTMHVYQRVVRRNSYL